VADRAHDQDPLRGRTLIGVVERVALPEWGIGRLRAKIDTGARTSALHVHDVEELADGRVRFWIVLDRKRGKRLQVEAPIARESRVRSSSGRSEKRFFVSTLMRLGPVEKTIEISLASREPMIHRMLLGRQALAHDFVIDPANRHLTAVAGKSAKKKKKKASSA
jgi:hypothetical protein